MPSHDPVAAVPAPAATAAFGFDNTYARELEGFYVPWKPMAVPTPRVVYFDDDLARELGVGPFDDVQKAQIFSGNVLPTDATPLAQVYAGHQFGGFASRLGDGRALLLGEVIDRHGERRDIAFKGSGRTPFARGGDGKAALGPMLREVIVSASMHALGVPTTRALAVVATGEPVYREGALPGAVLTRVAASHLRVGTFEYFAARGEVEQVRRLARYAIARHDPALVGAAQPFHGLLRAVIERQARLIAQWMNVGFIHGVMNTDNMTISGETIDYGPCAFMETYDPATVFSSIDERGRYAYGNQPAIAQWNLARFAETLLPLLDPDRERAIGDATEAIGLFPTRYAAHRLAGQRAKLGLRSANADDAADATLAAAWLDELHARRIDFTLAWRRLADAAEGNAAPLRELAGEDAAGLDAWLARWHARCRADDAMDPHDDDAREHGAAPDPGRARAARMRCVNPLVIARNHRVEEALTAAWRDHDLTPFRHLLDAVRNPFLDAPAQAPYARPAPAEITAGYRTFCGT